MPWFQVRFERFDCNTSPDAPDPLNQHQAKLIQAAVLRAKLERCQVGEEGDLARNERQ